jgi:H+/Cl- antiporter ClcA
MFVSGVMTTALVIGSAFGRIAAGIFELALIDVIAVHMMKVAVMDIVNMVTMFDGCMAAIVAVLVFVIRMCLASHYLCPSLVKFES